MSNDSRIIPYEEIVGSVSQQTNIDKDKTKFMTDAIIRSIRKHISAAENVQIPPLGTIFVKKRKGHYVTVGKKGQKFDGTEDMCLVDGQPYVHLKVNSKIKPEIREAKLE